METKVWAHRGASGYAPENTLEAFELAMRMGAYGIELDVHRTKDGKLVVIHDETVNRTSNATGYIKDYTCQELKKLDFSNSMSEFKNTRIPTLREVFGLIRASSIMLNILVKLSREFGMDDRIIYSSFNHYVLRELKKIKPQAPTGLLYSCAILDPWVYAEYAEATAIHPHFMIPLNTPGLVEQCHENGIAINAWTANEPEHIAGLVQLGVDGIITNYPDVAIKLLDK